MDAKEPAARPAATRAARVAILAVFVALVAWRLPHVFVGRLWAEEGVIYFANAWCWPWYDAWFAIHTGYLNLAAGLGTWVGLMIGGVARGPLITVFIALALQCAPPLAIMTHDYPWRRSLALTAAAVLLCAVPPLMGEVWLNTITSQFHLGLFAALLLAAPSASGGLFVADCACLCLAALSGPTTSFLLPLFALKTFFARDRRTLVLALIVFAGFCIQAGIYLFHIMPQRGDRLGLPALLSLIGLHTVILPLGGEDVAYHYARLLDVAHALHRPLLPGAAIFLGFYLAGAWLAWRARCAALGWMLAAAVVVSFLSFYEALNGSFAELLGIDGGQRYALIPIVLNGLALVGLAGASRGVTRWACSGAVVWLLLLGLAQDRRDTGMFANGPAWVPQLAGWYAKPTKVLEVWPGPPWWFTLPPH